MGDEFDYRFEDMARMNAAVRARLGEFSTTLEDFKRTYTEMASNWGGAAAADAGEVALRLDKFGKDTALLVTNFLKELENHLAESEHVEDQNRKLFAG